MQLFMCSSTVTLLIFLVNKFIGKIYLTNFLNWLVNIFSTWECEGDKKGGTDKRSMKYCLPAIQGGEDYMVNRLYLVNQEMKKLFNADRYMICSKRCSTHVPKGVIWSLRIEIID